MAEPATYAGYKVGTLIALLMGSGVAAGLTPGPWYVRAFAGLCGASSAFVFTPFFGPLALKGAASVYAWVSIPATEVPVDGVIGMTGFALAILGIDFCRGIIEHGKGLISRVPINWPKPK